MSGAMHLHFEKSVNARCDCPLLSLSWMGKVPDELPADEEGWKLNRNNYYQQGWLASGNVRGVLGVTFTSCHRANAADIPLRTNYNLRGHRTEVSLVKWNEPYQKLASCDSSGIIFVWIKYEGRWSIELINDRNTQVTDFSWSHDGRMALICYQDGFVLVGSVAGQRYWSSMLDIDATITCGVWSPDDRQVLFGTSDGQIVVMDVHGAMVAQVNVLDTTAIVSMGWSCEKFKMEEGDAEDDEDSKNTKEKNAAALAVSFKNGLIYIMKNYDDVSPVIVVTGLKGLKMEWSNAGDVLAVAGSIAANTNSPHFTNYIHFYTDTGRLRHSRLIPATQHQISAITWGHNDKRLFIATGPFVHVGWVTRKVASLQLLSRLTIYQQLPHEQQARSLLLPNKLLSLVVGLFSPTLKTYFPEPHQLRDFVSRPPEGGARYHCTMIRHDEEIYLNNGGTCYTLYLEYLGGLVPLLKGKRSSKIRPEFIIYDPQVTARSLPKESGGECSGGGGDETMRSGRLAGVLLLNGCHGNGVANQSDSDTDDGCASPRLQRRRKQMKRLLREQMSLEQRLVNGLAYVDTLPEHESLVIVTSNIWGTKFKINGVDTHLPTNLGQVTYKTSLLHLQPRQMTLCVTELGDDVQQLQMDVKYNGSGGGGDDEEEEDAIVESDENRDSEDEFGVFPLCHKEGPPIAPMTPRPPNRRSILACSSPSWSDLSVSSASIASHDEYVDLTPLPLSDVIVRPSHDHCMCDHALSISSCDNQEQPSSTVNALPAGRTHHHHHDHRSTSFVSTNCACARGCKLKNCLEVSKTLSPTGPAAANTNSNQRVLRWAEKARDLKFIDDDEDSAGAVGPSHGEDQQQQQLNKCRSHSVTGQLNYMSVATSHSFHISQPARDMNRRLILSTDGRQSSPASTDGCGKSPVEEVIQPVVKQPSSPLKSLFRSSCGAASASPSGVRTAPSSPLLSSRASSPLLERNILCVTPPTPRKADFKAKQKKNDLRRKSLLNSPLLTRRSRRTKVVESSDDEVTLSGDESNAGSRPLTPTTNNNSSSTKEHKSNNKLKKERMSSSSRRFVMHNKAPLWNENSQVYQLDFGGRVTQESAKNFQIEFRGKQVMQFGRIDGNAYTLDFQYPFTALQAFAVALANVTQRLK